MVKLNVWVYTVGRIITTQGVWVNFPKSSTEMVNARVNHSICLAFGHSPKTRVFPRPYASIENFVIDSLRSIEPAWVSQSVRLLFQAAGTCETCRPPSKISLLTSAHNQSGHVAKSFRLQAEKLCQCQKWRQKLINFWCHFWHRPSGTVRKFRESQHRLKMITPRILSRIVGKSGSVPKIVPQMI